MAKTTIDVVQLSFSLAKNTETITQKVLNDLGAIAEKADGIALNINDENIQKQLSGIKAMLEGELSNINIGHLGSDFLKMFLDINRSAEENAQGLDDFYNKLIQISRLPEELKTKLSGIKGIQWDDLFKGTTVNTQNIDEDVKKYLVSEEKAIEKLGKLYKKYEELDSELYTDRKRTIVDPSVQKEMNQNLAEQAKYYARLKALKKMTEDEWMDWTTNQDFSFDTGVIEDGLDSISTKTKETIAKIEALGDLNFNKKIEKIFDATKFQNNIQSAIENGTLVGSGGSGGGFGGDYTLNAKLDITEEEIQALVSKVKTIFEQSPINPKLVFEDSELQTLLSKVKELFESNAIDAKINISEDEIRKIKELISISNQQKADSEANTANQVINISDGEIYSVLDKIQSIFDEKQINVKIDVSDEAIANVREKISEFSEYGLAARIGLWADIDGFIQKVSDEIEDAQFTAHVQLKDKNGNPIVNGVNVNTGTVTTTSKNSDEQPVIVSPVTFLKMFKEWNEAERINVRANKSLAYLNERGMFFNPETGDHTNPYVYDKHSRFSANNELIEEFKKLNNNAQSFNSYIHTHPESKTAFSDMDFQAMKTYKNRGIDHQYVMGLENVTHFNTKDFDASDFDKLTKHMEGVVEAFYKTQKDKNGKLFAERKYSGETFKNYLEWGGKYDQFMTDTVETLQKSLLNSKNNIDLTNPDVALNFKNLTSSKGMMEDVVESIFKSKILVGENNYLSPSKYEQAISKELWGALGIDPNLKNLPDIAKPLKTAIGWVNNLNTFGSMGSDRGKYTSRDIRDALDDYSYKTTYDLIDSMVDQNGKKKYDASKIMQQWTKDYFFANDPQHLGGTVLKQMQDSGVADGASQLESIISPLTGKLEEVSTAIEANTTAINSLSDSLKSQKDTKKTEPQKQTATKAEGTKATRSKASAGAENGKTQPTPLQDAVNKLTAEVKHASELLSGITNGVQQDGNVQSVEQTKQSTKKKTATKKEEPTTSPEEKPQEQPNVKITGEMAKGLEALSPLKGSIDALKTSVDGATSAIKSIGTNKIQPDKNKIIGKQEEVKAYTSSDEESDGKKYIEYYDPKYIEEYFKKDTRRNISRYNGTTFYNYLKSSDTFDSLTKEIINYAGQSVIDGMAKSGQPLDQKAMKKLLEIQNPKNQEKFLNGIFSSGILRGENNYLNPDKYNNAIINAVLKQIDTIIEKPVRDAILEQFRGRENPLSKYFTSFMQIEDQTPYYKPELRDKVLSFITETYGNIPKLRKEIKPEEPKTESPTIQQQKPNQTEDALGPHVTNLINAVEQNTTALNGLSDKLSSTKVYADPSGSRKAVRGTKSRKTENTTASDTEKPKVEKEISQEQQQQNENLKSQISYREQGLSLLQQQSEAEQKERLYLEQQARDAQKYQDEQLAAIQAREQIEKRKAKEEKERREREEKERRENISNARSAFIDSSVYDTKAKKKEQERERQRQLAEQRAAESIVFSRSNVDQGVRNNQSEQIIRGYKELADLQRKLQVMYLDGAEESSIAKQIELINQKKNAIQELIAKVGELRDSEKNAQNEYNNSADEFDLSSPNNYARKTLNERLNTYSNRATSLRDYQFVHGTPTTEFYDRIDNILNLINEVRSKDGLDLTNEKDITYLNDVESKIRSIFADLEVDKKVDKDLYRRLYSAVNPNIVNTKVGQFYDYIKRNSKAKYVFKDRINELNEQADFLWRNNDSISPPMFEEFRDSFNNFMTDVKARGLEGISFMDKIGKKFQDVAAYFASFVSIYQVINVIRQAGAAVLDLNSKLIELSKVSNTSIADLEHQFQSFSEISKEIGGTVSDTIQATADWARNGYSLPDSKELARVAQIYKNVGDGIDINQANESLISTLRGYNLEAKDALSIVDKINSVANTQPIDSGGLGEALQRSAASFQAANTSLSESIALITASNAVVQHPERVGNMWKTNKTVLLYRNVHREYI